MSEVFKVEGKVSLDASEFHSSVDQVTKEGKGLAENIGQQASGMQSALQNAFSFSLGNIGSDIAQKAAQLAKEFVTESVSVASSLQEVQNVVDVTFGDAAGQIEQWAASARTEFGLTELQAKQFSSTMGAMLKSMGVTEDKVYDMSTAMAGLAADMASFYDINFEDAFTKIRSGISGETEPLKQLGINMSVANLEAYALANGISKTYESMTQAEQATLRYNYLMSVTADAQGDFARTSDSYANNLRTLETNIDSLKASLGEALLPTINSVVSAINSLFEHNDTMSGAADELANSFEENSASIIKNQARANQLIDTIARLEEKEEMTAEETLQHKGAMDALLKIYPSLATYVDETTGKFNASATAIKEETAALAENLIQKAKIAYFEERLTTAAKNQAKAEAEYAEAFAASMEAVGVADEASERLESQADLFASMKDVIANIFDLNGIDPDSLNLDMILDNLAEGKSLFESLENYAALISFDEGQISFIEGIASSYAKLNKEQKEAAENERQAAVVLEEKSKALETATNNMEAETAAYEEYLGVAAEAENVLNTARDSLDGTSTLLTDSVDCTEEFTAALEELLEQGEDVQKMFDELEEYKLNNFESIRKQVEGVYGAFDKADRVRKQSSKKMLKNQEGQIDFNERFKTVYQSLKESGASDDLMSQFDYSAESIGQMEALLKGGAEAIASASENAATLKAQQAEIAGALSETALSVDTEFQAMNQALAEAQTAFEEAKTAIVESAANMTVTIGEQTMSATDLLEEVGLAGDEVASSDWKPEIKAQDKASSTISKIKNALEKLTAEPYTVVLNIVTNGALPGGAPHATGLDFVPYDDYAARLHRGEAVLTKAEADNWRKGEKTDSGLQPINVTLNLTGIAQNPYEVADEVRNALELMRWRT